MDQKRIKWTHFPRRAMPEWSPREEEEKFEGEVDEVEEDKEEEEGGGREYRREQE